MNRHTSRVELYLKLTILCFALTAAILVFNRLQDSSAAQTRFSGTVFIRGYIAVAVDGKTDNPQVAAVSPAHDAFIPGVKVFLRDLVHGTDGPPVVTDLSGRFTIKVNNPNPGRYNVCWSAQNFVEACSKEIFSLSNKAIHLRTLRMEPKRDRQMTVLFGKVRMKDGSSPRSLDPLNNVNSFATVELLDSAGRLLQRAYVNNFAEYLLPRVPGQREITLRTTIEGIRQDQRIFPEANIDHSPFNTLNLEIANTPPKLEELVPTTAAGRRIKIGQPGSTVHLTARASDAENDPMIFKWEVDDGSGSLSAVDRPDTQWTLPNSPGLYSVKVMVWDKKGGYKIVSTALRVDADGGIPFSGKVDATDSPAVAGAEVEVNGRKTKTGTEGFFKINVRDASRFVLNIRKAGYGLVSRVYDDAVTGAQWTMTKATTTRVNPLASIDVVDRRDERNCPGSRAAQIDWRNYFQLAQPQWQDGKGNIVPAFAKLEAPLPGSRGGQRRCGPGAEVHIPADALRDEQRRAPNGPVDISVTTIDLNSPGQMPGDFTVKLPGGGTRAMQSYGAATVDITSGARRFNLRPGVTARIVIPVDSSQLAAGGPLPATIPLLTYDERNGEWVQEGIATLVGNAYVARVKHFSSINTDQIKINQSCVRIKSPLLPSTYKLEYTIPVGGGAAPIVRLADIDNTAPSEHVIYNLPSATNIVLVPIRSDTNVPFGTFVVNTGGPQSPTTPNLPVGPPYAACSTEVVLTDVPVPEDPVAGEFLHGLYSFAATNLDELDPLDPSDTALRDALDQATTNYYAQIDPRGKRTTLDGFRTTNGFPTGEINVKFANSGDLGFGRDMHCTKTANADIGGSDVACYVTNYGSINTPDSDDAAETVTGLHPVATVAMEFSRIESAPGTADEFDDPERVVKFYVYNAAGTQLLKSANLDAKGARPIPQLCMVCHNGEYPGAAVPTGAPPFNSRDDTKLGARFLPFDLHYYTFAPAPNDKASQQAAFKLLNETIVKDTPPDATYISDIITKMYTPGPAQNENFVVTGWNAQPIEQGMYREVVGRVCRTCHAANIFPALQFDLASQVKDTLGSIEGRVCVEHVMPHAKVPHQIFWSSVGPNMPAQLQVFGDTFGNGLNGWNGTLCGSFTPGGATPVSFYTSTIQPIWDGVGTGTRSCTGCHFGSTPPGGLNLTAGNSYTNLFNVDSRQLPSMKRVFPGDASRSYLFHKISGTQASVGGSGDQMPLRATPLSPATRAVIENWINSGAPGP